MLSFCLKRGEHDNDFDGYMVCRLLDSHLKVVAASILNRTEKINVRKIPDAHKFASNVMCEKYTKDEVSRALIDLINVRDKLIAHSNAEANPKKDNEGLGVFRTQKNFWRYDVLGSYIRAYLDYFDRLGETERERQMQSYEDYVLLSGR